jgi:N-acetylmuramic acid 6-phosphate etherase
VPSKQKSVRATEQRNSRTRGFDLLSTHDLLRTLNREDATVPRAVAKEIPTIARAVEIMATAIANGGRVFYIGAGTSGRLATLDASEIPPTFGVSPNLIQAVIAGGTRALTHAVEGAEDSSLRGVKDIAARRITNRDVIIGITASGSTSYVLGGLSKAAKVGAATIGITSNRNSPIARAAKILIATNTGAEAVSGSTRLKAGTAQKLVLNMLSTATMVRLGRVYDNWMIGVALTNQKLRKRGQRILEEATGASVSDAARALRQAGHDPCVALIMLKKNLTAAEARRKLRAANGNIRKALGEFRNQLKK